MADLQMNGNYDSYLAQLFNPLAGGGQGIYGAAGIGGQMIGGNQGVNLASLLQNPQMGLQNPQIGQGFGSQNTIWPQQQQIHGQAQNQAHALAAVQFAQQVVARHAVHAIQIAQALQNLQQIIQNQLQQTAGIQGQFGQGQFGQGQFGQGQFGQGPIGQGLLGQGLLGQGLLGGFGQPGQGLGQFNSWGMQNPGNQAQQQQALQQQALQQLAQNLAAQQQQQPAQFRYGMGA
jgi:hypothetical protein